MAKRQSAKTRLMTAAPGIGWGILFQIIMAILKALLDGTDPVEAANAKATKLRQKNFDAASFVEAVRSEKSGVLGLKP
jgi:hypothetical protein